MTMTATNFDLLITALRSDRYLQAQQALRAGTYDEDGEDIGTGYCCLGVYCAERGVDLDRVVSNEANDAVTLGEFGGTDDIENTPLEPVLEDFTADQRNQLARMNDHGESFHDIANYLANHRAEFVLDSVSYWSRG